LDPSMKLSADSGKIMSDPTLYMHLIDKLNYLTHTRPDLCHSVLLLSQFMQQPCLSYHDAALRVVSHLKCTHVQGLFMSASSSFALQAFCDADCVSCKDTRRSISGFFISLRGLPIS